MTASSDAPLNWLELPSASRVSPPIRTRRDGLPLGELDWEDFERLCLRLIRLDSTVEDARLYGDRGQKQEGIDILAREVDGSRRVLQSKRVRVFSAADVRRAVNRFVEGDWFERAPVFILAVATTTSEKSVANEIDAQASRLAEHDVRLLVWDVVEISNKLRNQPGLVDDFFGRAWVQEFIGEEVATDLGERLDGAEVARLRADLAKLYRSIFQRNDPGIPIPSAAGRPTPRFPDWLVLPDVHRWDSTPQVSRVGGDGEAAPGQSTSGEASDDTEQREPRSLLSIDSRLRESIDSWLSTGDYALLTGPPGSGKSSVLRFVTLDLLSTDPLLPRTSARWGLRLPVWVPFAYWTQNISTHLGSGASLVECLRAWLREYSADRLIPLLERALRDDRLLLVIDGLDERDTESSGRQAADALQVFLDTSSAVALVSTRRQALSRLNLGGEQWRFAEIASLNPAQQAELSSRWFALKAESESGGAPLTEDDSERADLDAQRFLDDLSRIPAIRSLAGNPLLLSLLLYLRFQRSVLPRDRFNAYKHFIEHLVEERPAARREAARIRGSSVFPSDSTVLNALAALAYQMHCSGRVVIQESAAKAIVSEHLSDESLGLALPSAEAEQLGEELVTWAETQLGILARQGEAELRFLHWTFVEFLAGKHLSRKPIAEQEAFMAEAADDPAYSEVVLSLLRHSVRAEDVERLLDVLQSELDPLLRPHVSEILAEVAFGDFEISPGRAKSLASETLDQVETSPSRSIRSRLLAQAARGLDSLQTNSIVRARLRTWTPGVSPYELEVALRAVADWPADETVHFLNRALHDADGRVVKAAASTLARIGRDDPAISEQLVSLARHALAPALRAAALDALSETVIDGELPGSLVAEARSSSSSDLRVAAVKRLVGAGQQEQQDLDAMLHLSNSRTWSSYDPWLGLIPEIIAEGWAGDAGLLDTLLVSLQRDWRDPTRLDGEAAMAILTRAFPQNARVAGWIAEEMKKKHPFPGIGFGLDRWGLIAEHFRDNPVVVRSFDRYLDEFVVTGERPLLGPELLYASKVGRTATAKRVLLSDFERRGGGLHWAAAGLVEGWGLDDAEVRDALLGAIEGGASEASNLSNWVADLAGSREEAIETLSSWLMEPGSRRSDMIVTALSGLGAEMNDAMIARCQVEFDNQFGPLYPLIAHYAQSPVVRARALELVGEREPPLSLLARSYAGDPEMRVAISRRLAPLPGNIRTILTDELSGVYDPGGLALETLSRFDSDSDSDAVMAGSIAYHDRLRSEQAPSTEAYSKLTKMMRATGPHYREDRQAAFAGVLSLGQSQKFAEEDSNLLTHALPGGTFDSYLAQERFLRVIGKHWEELADAFDGQFLTLLEDDEESFWRGISKVGSEFPALHSGIIDAVEHHPSIRRSPEILGFLDRTKLDQAMLKASAADVLSGGGEETLGQIQTASEAARIFASNFGGDSDSRELLVGSTAELTGWRMGVTSALVLGWPDDPLITDLYQRLILPEREPVPVTSYLAVLFTRHPANRIADEIEACFSRIDGLSTDQIRMGAVDPLVARIRRDGGISIALGERLESGASASFKASVPRLLSLAGKLSPKLEEWCDRELRTQLAGSESPEIGYDLVSAQSRAVGLSLLDALDAGGPVRSGGRR